MLKVGLGCFFVVEARIQNAVSVVLWKDSFNTKIAFHIAAKMRFNQPKNLFDVAVSLQISIF